MKFVSKMFAFLKAVAGDERIPERDKKVLLALVALIVSPIDLIPDWIPLFGLLDDIVVIAIILDYLFNRLDQAILLSHYPWGLKSFIAIRRLSRIIAALTPTFIQDRIWKFKPTIGMK